MYRYVDILPEVKEALDNNRPVVAMESTIISHGMPYPMNLECAMTCGDIIQEYGATPATIAILDGRIKIGLTEDQLHHLAESELVPKCSRRDLPYILSCGYSAATTVSASVIIASQFGIHFYATGGLGGVHRGAETSMDISSDLVELGEADACVVSAGIKSILDIGRTMEYLETLGVPVVAFGQDDFPAFYTRESGYTAPIRLDTPAEVAKMMKIKWELGLRGGAIIGNPIPMEFAMMKHEIDSAINSALHMASKRGVTGKDTTPFLLEAVKELTEGRSVDANLHLVYNNARLAAEIAAAYFS